MPLNAAGVASSVNSAYQDVIATNDNSTSLAAMAAAWQSAIHADASAGVNPIAAAAAPATASIIGAAYAGLTSNAASNADILANMFASYWATSHLTPIPPCVTITSNDAATKVSAYKAAINSAVTNIETTPYLEGLFIAVEGVTKTIVWHGVTSLGSPLVGSIT